MPGTMMIDQSPTRILLDKRRSENNKSLIFRLPVELIHRIILIAIWNSRRHHDLAREDRDWNWLTVSHICSRWREIVLGCSSVWSVIEMNNHEARIELLKRSGFGPLNLSIEFGGHHHVDLSALVSTVMPRVRKFRCKGHGLEFQQFVDEISKSPAPILERFEIETVPVPQNMFRNDTPRLRKVHLRGTSYMGPEFPLFRNIKQLDAQFVRFCPQENYPQIYQAFQILAPTIEAIDFTPDMRTFQPRLTTNHPPRPPGELIFPKLKNLVLRGDVVVCSYLLSHVKPSHPFTVGLLFDISALDQVYTLLQWIRYKMRIELEADPRGATRLEICTQPPSECLEIQISSTLPSGPGTNLFFTSDVNGEDAGLILLEAIQFVLITSFPLTQVRTLCVEGLQLNSHKWIRNYGHLKKVERVEIRSDELAHGFFLALSQQADHKCPNCGCGEHDVPGEVFLPKLRELVICNVNLNETIMEPTNVSSTPGALLYQCVRERQVAGLGLEKLEISDCGSIAEELLSNLREVVGDLVYKQGRPRKFGEDSSEDEIEDLDDDIDAQMGSDSD